MQMTQKDRAVEMILRCYNNRKNGAARITANMLVNNGICTDKELQSLMSELSADGLIEQKRFGNEPFLSIVPTPKCQTYFRDMEAAAEEKRRESIQIWVATAVQILIALAAIGTLIFNVLKG